MRLLFILLLLAIFLNTSSGPMWSAGFADLNANQIQNNNSGADPTAALAQNNTASPSPSPSPTPEPGEVIAVPRPSIVKIEEVGFLIGAIAAVMIIIAAILAFLYLIMGGIQWITSGGDKANMEAARNKIVNAIVGLVIVASAWALMTLVQNFLGITLLGGTINIPKPFVEASPTPFPSPTPPPTTMPSI